MKQARQAKDKVQRRGDAYSRGHEPAYIAVIGNESVGELPYRIYEIEGGAYDTQLAGGEEAAVYEGLLHNAKGHAANIV